MNYATNEITIVSLVFDLSLFAGTVVPSNAQENMHTTTGPLGSDGKPTLDPEFGKINDEEFIRMHEAQLVFDRFGGKVNIPMNSGTSVRFFKKQHLDPILNPLTEGLTPNPNKFTITAFTADVEQYGDWLMFSDVATQTSLHNLMKQVRQPQAYQAAKTRNILARNELMAGAQAAYCSKIGEDGTETEVESISALDLTCKLTVKEVQKMVARARAKDIPPAVGEDYIMIVHPDALFDLKRDPEYKDWNKGERVEKFENGEVGRIDGCRFVDSSIAGITKDGAIIPGTETKDEGVNTVPGSGQKYAVYHNLFFGAEAYDMLDIAGGGVKVIVKEPGSAGTADPLDQRCSIGWKSWNGTCVKDDEAIWDLMCCTSKSAKAQAN